jgi:hypothetical protein
MMHRVVIHLPSEIYERMHVEAQRRTIGVSTLIRQLLIDANNRVENRGNPPPSNLTPVKENPLKFTEAVIRAGGAYTTYKQEGGTLDYDAWRAAGYPRGGRGMLKDAEFDQALFRDYHSNGGRMTVFADWVAAGKPYKDNNK